MKKILFIIISIVGLLLLFASPVSATKKDKVQVCHAAGQGDTIHYVTLEVPANEGGYPQGHFTENGTQAAGHENDYLGACVDSTPSEEPSPSPCPDNGQLPGNRGHAWPFGCPSPSPEISPSPSPSPETFPSPSIEPSSEPSTEPSVFVPTEPPPTDMVSSGSGMGGELLILGFFSILGLILMNKKRI